MIGSELAKPGNPPRVGANADWYKWCGEELAWFGEQFKGRREPPGRVFIIRAVSTNEGQWPDFLKDERGHADLGFKFHPGATEEGEAPFGWPDLRHRPEEFDTAFKTLRTALIGRLKLIRGNQDALRTAELRSAPAPTDAGTAHLAKKLCVHLPVQPGPTWDAVQTRLRADGYIVIPAPRMTGVQPLAEFQRESRKRIGVAARRCDALILLRPENDDGFDDDLLAIGGDELSRMAAERGRPLPCAVLDAADAPFELADFAELNGIRRFSVRSPSWASEFRSWMLNQPAGAAP